MKRPLVFFCVSLIAGIVAAYTGGSLLFVLALPTFLAVVYFTFLKKLLFFRKVPEPQPESHKGLASSRATGLVLIGMLLFYTVGACEYLILNRQYTHRFEAYHGKQVTIRGVVTDQPQIKDAIVSYILRVDEIEGDGRKQTGGKILLNVLKKDDASLFEYGSRLKISGELTLPEGSRNPGGFNYRRYLSQQGISAMVFAQHWNIRLEKRQEGFSAIQLGFAIRQSIMRVLNASLPRQQAGLMNGMLIGIREGLSKQVQQVFSDSGLSHIVAASGANVVFIITPFLFILRRLRIPERIAKSAAIAVVLLYVLVTGFEPSIVRAAIMAITVLVGQILWREADTINSLSFAAILMLLYNPLMLFALGFQLSFGATLSLVLFSKNIRKYLSFRWLPGGVADVAAATLAAQAGVLPITVLSFNNISVISLLSNLLVAPLTGIVTILGAVMALVGQVSVLLSEWIGYANCTLLSAILYISKVTSELPYAVIKVVTPGIVLVGLYYAVLGYIFWYRPKYGKKKDAFGFLVAVVLMVMVLIPSLWPSRELTAVFLDVGQGDACFIKTYSGKTVLIDGGGDGGEGRRSSGVGERVVIPFLLDAGVSKIDLVIASHGHEDHIGGLLPVLEHMKVGCLVYPAHAPKEDFEELFKVAEEKGTQIVGLEGGQNIKLDGKTSFKVLSPLSKHGTDKTSLNNTSIVLKLLYADTEVLFTGDAEKELEELLLYNDADLEADVLKVAHHGSNTSSTAEFLQKVSSKAAVISVGKNYFGHPSPDVLERLESQGVQLFRTDESGAVTMTSDGSTIRFRRMIE